MTAPTEAERTAIRAEVSAQVAEAFGDTIREVIAPMRDAWHDIEDATADLGNDAVLGAKVRDIVRGYRARKDVAAS